MGKIKLAICLSESEYRDRLVKCLMSHYRDRYEIHVFEDIEELIAVQRREYHGYILCEAMAQEWQQGVDSVEDMEHVLVLTEENKYREVYHIVQELELVLGDVVELPGRGETAQIVGVIAPAATQMQLSFTAMLAELLSEESKAIVVDLQAYSGLSMIATEGMGLEDLMVASQARAISKSRVQSAIGHMNTWDYIRPVRNSSYLQEAGMQMLADILEVLDRELEYRTIILNIGESVGPLHELMALCNRCYLPYPRGNVGSWREEAIIRELQRRGHDDCLHRICRVEISASTKQDEDWLSVAARWKWEQIGNHLRHLIWEAKHG